MTTFDGNMHKGSTAHSITIVRHHNANIVLESQVVHESHSNSFINQCDNITWTSRVQLSTVPAQH
jgi:hypothetical protein